MRLSIDVTLDYTIDGEADVLLLIEAAKGPDQRLELQDLRVHSPEPLRAVRNLGLNLLDKIPVLKRRLISHAMGK